MAQDNGGKKTGQDDDFDPTFSEESSIADLVRIIESEMPVVTNTRPPIDNPNPIKKSDD